MSPVSPTMIALARSVKVDPLVASILRRMGLRARPVQHEVTF